MGMAVYSFVTTWQLDAPMEQVWQAIVEYRTWPRWWPAIAESKRIAAGDASGLGEIADITFRTRLPYRVRFMITTTHIAPPHELDGRAVGELEGTGRWRLTAQDRGTLVRYYWDVRTTRRWMNVLAPVARRAFAWNHDQVMRSGEAGLRRHLAARARPPCTAEPAG